MEATCVQEVDRAKLKQRKYALQEDLNFVRPLPPDSLRASESFGLNHGPVSPALMLMLHILQSMISGKQPEHRSILSGTMS